MKSKLLFASGLVLHLGTIMLVSIGCADDAPPARIGNLPVGITAGSFGNKAIEILTKGTRTQKQAIIQQILESSDRYAPPVFYELSNALYQQGDKDEAAFWFYAGQLRARFDANRCADKSARQAVTVLNMHYGKQINQYMFKDVDKLKVLVPKVIDWDRKTKHNYDHRWIDSYGLAGVVAKQNKDNRKGLRTTIPKQSWEQIAEQTRASYLDGFRRVMSPTGRGHPKEYFTDPQVIALALATEVGDLREIDKLVDGGVDVNATGKKHVTPLVWAMFAGQEKAFKRLLECGADPNKQSPKGSSPISLAARDQKSDWLRMVLKHGGNPNLANPTDDLLLGKTTPIFDAISSRNKTNLDLLIKAGADVNHRDEIGRTPAIYAASSNWFDSVYYLLQAGADFRAKSKSGNDLRLEVIDSTVDEDHELARWRDKVIDFLKKHGVEFEP